MRGTYNCIRKVIYGGEPYAGDPFKRCGPYTILAGQQMDLWVKPQPTHGAAKFEEDTLNEFYRGEWSKEGWKKTVRRSRWPVELHENRAKLHG